MAASIWRERESEGSSINEAAAKKNQRHQ